MCIFQTYVFLDTEVDEKSQGSSFSFLLTTADSVEMLASLSPLMLAQHPEENKSSPLLWVPDQSELEAEIPAWISCGCAADQAQWELSREYESI